jgi:hypothetical protein
VEVTVDVFMTLALDVEVKVARKPFEEPSALQIQIHARLPDAYDHGVKSQERVANTAYHLANQRHARSSGVQLPPDLSSMSPTPPTCALRDLPARRDFFIDPP